jgi:hypothetical protein
MVEVICDREFCRHNNEDGGCDRFQITLDEDGFCEDFENDPSK